MTTQTDGPDWFHGPDGEPVPGPAGPSGPVAPEAFTQVLHESPGRSLADPDQDPAAGAAAADQTWDDDLLEDWAPARRANRLTAVLGIAVVAACTFTAGAVVQKQLGGATPTAAAATRGGFARGTGAGGFEAGGFGGGGFGGQAGQVGQTGAGGQAGAGGQGGAGGQTGQEGQAGQAPAAAPAVVGTVKSVQGTDLVVENFAGTRVTVHVPATASVTAPGLSGVSAGMTVSVVGTKGADGSVTATAVVARKA